MGQAIRSCIKEHKNWDKELPKIQQAINAAVYEVHNLPPALVNFGRNTPLSGRYYGDISSTESIELCPGNRKEYLEDLKGLTEVFDDVRRKLHQAYKRNSAAYNLRKKDFVFRVGEKC